MTSQWYSWAQYGNQVFVWPQYGYRYYDYNYSSFQKWMGRSGTHGFQQINSTCKRKQKKKPRTHRGFFYYLHNINSEVNMASQKHKNKANHQRTLLLKFGRYFNGQPRGNAAGCQYHPDRACQLGTNTRSGFRHERRDQQPDRLRGCRPGSQRARI